ncbi:hypothetical protein PHJA_002926200 [Phtheirospermum japonicum]|uniref:WW domain-containing protein n=1 Tax=Phtheirospermum japonicum TaxID=374723 RepID=A0A830DQ79_9LAMI|nr:hypothetical protein PHJA_002926200 [Phtheirospermum japonicum]
MSTPNMATITASLERSLQNCSLHHQQSSSSSSDSTAAAGGATDGSDSPPNPSVTPTLELNSEATLPFHWEQCLDLKTGEIYYINWRTGMKAKEDPRTTAAEYGGDYYSDDDNSSYDSDGWCSESSPSSREQWSGNSNNNQESSYYQENNNLNNNNNNNNNVLVVAGCKSCLMYYMVPKQLEICPKCCGQLLHFDRSENGSS